MDSLKTAIIVAIVFSSVLCSCRRVIATNHTVGGETGWDLVSNLHNWSTDTLFYTGDNLEFIYGPNHDVVEVNRDAFFACRISSPISTFDDGNTLIKLDQPGSRYFICGMSDHCSSGHKVQIDVLPLPTRRTNHGKPPKCQSSPPPKYNPSESPNHPGTEDPSKSSASPIPCNTGSLLLFALVMIQFL